MTNRWDEEPAPYIVPLSEDGTEVLSFALQEHCGWAGYFPDGNTGRRPANILLRFGARNRGDNGEDTAIFAAPFEIREIHVSAAEGVDLGSAVLRRIPFDRIEAAVNQPRHRDVIGRYVLRWRAVATAAPRVPVECSRVGLITWTLTPRQPTPNPAPPLQLPVAENARNRPDSFYAAVAEAFLWLASVSPRPAQDLAKENGVPVTTVHRWVREAKARGLLLLPTKGETSTWRAC